jgi:hypothetical protein
MLGILIISVAVILGVWAHQGRTSWIHALLFLWVFHGILVAVLSARLGLIGVLVAATMYLGERYPNAWNWLMPAFMTLLLVICWSWLPVGIRVQASTILAALSILGLIQRRLRLAIIDGRVRSRLARFILRIDGRTERTINRTFPGWSLPLQIQTAVILVVGFFLISLIGSYRLGQWSAKTRDTFLVVQQNRGTATVVVERYGDRVVIGTVDLQVRTVGPPWKLSMISQSSPLEGTVREIGRLTQR